MSLASPIRSVNGHDWVIGLDLSLTGTGIAIIGQSGIRTGVLKSVGHKGDTIAQRHARLSRLREQLATVIPENSLVVVEQPAYSQTAGHQHDRSGLWWLVVDLASSWRLDVVEVSPGTLKKYATGKGNAAKDQVLAAVIKRYPTADITDNNAADAMVLAAMGSRALGFPLSGEPYNLQMQQAMAAVHWPAGPHPIPAAVAA